MRKFSISKGIPGQLNRLLTLHYKHCTHSRPCIRCISRRRIATTIRHWPWVGAWIFPCPNLMRSQYISPIPSMPHPRQLIAHLTLVKPALHFHYPHHRYLISSLLTVCSPVRSMPPHYYFTPSAPERPAVLVLLLVHIIYQRSPP